MKNKLFLLLFISVILLSYSYQANSQGKFDAFKDSLDGSFDVSDWLLKKKDFCLYQH